MQRTELPFQEIYNNLLAGKKLALHFPNATAAETFRTRLAHHKSKQEKTLENLGMAVEDDRTVLTFKVQNSKDSEEVAVFVQFSKPPETRKYQVIILEDTDLAQV